MARHQSIQSVKIDTQTMTPVIEMSITELCANFRCAASLAEKEGMHETAERLRFDAYTFEHLHNTHQLIQILVG